MFNQKLSDEWAKLIQENLIPDRQEGELTLNEFCDVAKIGKASGERLLNKEMKSGRVSRHRAKVGTRTQFVYTIIKK